MTVTDLMAELSNRAMEARNIKEAAWDEPSQSESKWKLKVQWQNACERARLLQTTIKTIKAEKLGG